VFLGASTTAGFTVSNPSQAWVTRLQAAAARSMVTIVNLAVPGAVTSNWMPLSSPIPFRPAPLPANNIDAAMARQPKLVLLNATNNDIVVNMTPEETVANLLAIRAVAVAGGASVMMLSTQPRNFADSALAQLRAIDARLSPVFGGCFVDIRGPLAGGDGRLAPLYDSGDGIHPNDAGHAIIFERVETALKIGLCVAGPY
jgi:acyl-CoA thioesterase-1